MARRYVAETAPSMHTGAHAPRLDRERMRRVNAGAVRAHLTRPRALPRILTRNCRAAVDAPILSSKIGHAPCMRGTTYDNQGQREAR